MKEKLMQRSVEIGIPQFFDMIADEEVGTTEEEVLKFLQEKGHPALKLDPIM